MVTREQVPLGGRPLNSECELDLVESRESHHAVTVLHKRKTLQETAAAFHWPSTGEVKGPHSHESRYTYHQYLVAESAS